MKKCGRCQTYKELKEFGNCKSTKDKLNKRCKDCSRILGKLNNIKYKEKITKQKKEYRNTEKGRAVVNKATNKWQHNNRQKLAEYSKNRCKIDIQFKLKKNLRTRLYNYLKKNQTSISAVRDMGCTVEQLKQYLETLFQPGMTWENWTKDGWHIDHIRPLASFDLTDQEQFLQAVHYTNLQPLWAKDNILKSDKYDQAI